MPTIKKLIPAKKKNPTNKAATPTGKKDQLNIFIINVRHPKKKPAMAKMIPDKENKRIGIFE